MSKYLYIASRKCYDVIMTSPFVQFFENVNLSSSYEGLQDHNKFGLIWIKESKVTDGGGPIPNPPPRLRIYKMVQVRVKLFVYVLVFICL